MFVRRVGRPAGPRLWRRWRPDVASVAPVAFVSSVARQRLCVLAWIYMLVCVCSSVCFSVGVSVLACLSVLCPPPGAAAPRTRIRRQCPDPSDSDLFWRTSGRCRSKLPRLAPPGFGRRWPEAGRCVSVSSGIGWPNLARLQPCFSPGGHLGKHARHRPNWGNACRTWFDSDK